MLVCDFCGKILLENEGGYISEDIRHLICDDCLLKAYNQRLAPKINATNGKEETKDKQKKKGE